LLGEDFVLDMEFFVFRKMEYSKQKMDFALKEKTFVLYFPIEVEYNKNRNIVMLFQHNNEVTHGRR
jgi:hypothetical protein